MVGTVVLSPWKTSRKTWKSYTDINGLRNVRFLFAYKHMSGLYSRLLNELQCVNYNILDLESSLVCHETLKNDRFQVE